MHESESYLSYYSALFDHMKTNILDTNDWDYDAHMRAFFNMD